MLPQSTRPVGRWLRLSDAAALLDLDSPDLLRAQLAQPGTNVRACRMGKRGLLMVAQRDIEALRARMESGALL